MRTIEQLARSTAWNPSDQATFYTALKRCRSDGRRLELCEQKATALSRNRSPAGLQHAITLLRWAVATYPGSPTAVRGLCYRTLGQLQEASADFAAAAAAYRQAMRLNSQLAVMPLRLARALLRANHLVASPEVLTLESAVVSDKHAGDHTAYQVWTYIIAAVCAQARGDDAQAQLTARQALTSLTSAPRPFEQVVLSKGVRMDLDLRAEELALLAHLARLDHKATPS